MYDRWTMMGWNAINLAMKGCGAGNLAIKWSDPFSPPGLRFGALRDSKKHGSDQLVVPRSAYLQMLTNQGQEVLLWNVATTDNQDFVLARALLKKSRNISISETGS
jgi:hypothetical protein